MTLYLAMRIYSADELAVPGLPVSISLPREMAGVLLVFWTREDAKRACPGQAIMEIVVSDAWTARLGTPPAEE